MSKQFDCDFKSSLRCVNDCKLIDFLFQMKLIAEDLLDEHISQVGLESLAMDPSF